jgi:hypothetical protein
MKLERTLFVGLFVLALGIPALGAGQAATGGANDQPEFDPEIRLYGYPSLGIKPQFSHALAFSPDGLARVIVGCRYASCTEGSPGYNRMNKRVWAFIDKSFDKEPGTYDIFDPRHYAIFDERFTFANSFSKDYPGLAKVKLADDPKSYYINLQGEVQFVETKDGLTYVDRTGEAELKRGPLCETEDKISCLDMDAMKEK